MRFGKVPEPLRVAKAVAAGARQFLKKGIIKHINGN
jgi:hypothetical protein